jgi:tRNA dimethylallyltransferase
MGRPVITKKLLLIVGATAVGKTDISLKLAAQYDCPILSADSRQCYRELGVATAKPDLEMLSKVSHYFINSHSIHNPVTAAEFEAYALATLREVFEENNICIMTGGSGLYVKAVCEGLDEIPPVPESIRHQLEDRLEHEGLKVLLKELQVLDPEYAETIDAENPRRVIRALEVCLGTGKPISTFRKGKVQPRPFETLKIGLHRDRKKLYLRIDQRIDEMIRHGLFEEAEQLYEFRNLKPLQTVGYQEVFGYLEEKYDRKEMTRLLKRNSRRYAKRQLTWFGKDPSIRWFQADDLESITDYLQEAQNC